MPTCYKFGHKGRNYGDATIRELTNDFVRSSQSGTIKR